MRVLGVVAVLGLVGCMSGDGMQTKLRETTVAYHRALRWGDIDRAAEFLPAEAQQAFLSAHDEFREDLVVVDYEMLRLDLDKTSGVAACRAQFWWHTQDSTVIESTSVDQLWQFHEGKFVLVDERRSSGERLGVFAEFIDDEHPWLPGLEAYRKSRVIGEANKKKQTQARKAARKAPAPTDVTPPSWRGHRGAPEGGTAKVEHAGGKRVAIEPG